MPGHEGVEVDGRWICQAKRCPHRIEGGGCKLGKCSLSCENTRCRWNTEVSAVDHRCVCMDVHLDADGRCLAKNTD